VLCISSDIAEYYKAYKISNNTPKYPFELFSSIKKISKYTVLSDEIYPFVSGMESLKENNTFRKNKIFQT
jgi:hypothetical protein